jgi:hypothetical protein
MTAQPVVSCHVMAYREVMRHHHSRRSAAYRLGYAIGSTVTRLIVWPITTLLNAGDSE